jgi:betaine-aldehyde dehydrogenase
MKLMYINGLWVKAKSYETKEIINPFNQEVIETVPRGSREDAKEAILAARMAFDEGQWSNFTAAERGNLLYQVAQKIKEYTQELAELESLNTGKTVTESLDDMDGIAGVFQYYAGLADKDGGLMIESPNPNSVSRVV